MGFASMSTTTGKDQGRVSQALLTLARMHARIERLPDEQRAAMQSVVLEGRSYAEVADQYGITVCCVAERLASARETLARMLAAEAERPRRVNTRKMLRAARKHVAILELPRVRIA